MSVEAGRLRLYREVALQVGFGEEEIELLVSFSHYPGEINGLRSELRAVYLLERLPIVVRVLRASHDDDLNGHKDLWVYFRDELYPPVAVQVKSSKIQLDKFLRWREEKGERIIGLNCGPKRSDKEIVESFLSQISGFDDPT